jgi:hypothetical protein
VQQQAPVLCISPPKSWSHHKLHFHPTHTHTQCATQHIVKVYIINTRRALLRILCVQSLQLPPPSVVSSSSVFSPFPNQPSKLVVSSAVVFVVCVVRACVCAKLAHFCLDDWLVGIGVGWTHARRSIMRYIIATNCATTASQNQKQQQQGPPKGGRGGNNSA